MNIQIAIRILKELKNLYEAESTANKFRGTLSIPVDDEDVDAIETLLTAYEQEKEKNKELEKKYDEIILYIIRHNYFDTTEFDKNIIPTIENIRKHFEERCK